eukprot:g6174.t1
MPPSSTEQGDVRELVVYYARRGFSSYIATLCEREIRSNGMDYEIKFWQVYGKLAEGNQFGQCIRVLESLVKRKQVELATLHGLLYAHTQMKTIDHQAVAELEEMIAPAEQRADEASILLAARFCWLTRNHSAAKKLVKRVLKMNPSSIHGMAMAGWVEMSRKQQKKQEIGNSSIRFFEAAVQAAGKGQREISAMMGLVEFYTIQRDYTRALEWTNQTIVRHEWYTPAYLVKCKILSATGDWDQAVEIAQRVLDEDPKHVEALEFFVLYYLTQEGDVELAERHMRTLFQQLKKNEGNNAILIQQFVIPIAKVCGRRQSILQLCLDLMEYAYEVKADDSNVVVEVAHLYLLSSNIEKAMKLFRRASSLDESNQRALQGVIQCQILSGNLSDAKDQLDFFRVIQDGGIGIGGKVEIKHLEAQLAWKMNNDETKHVELLNEIVESKKKSWSEAGCLKNTSKWFGVFDADSLLQISDEYLEHEGGLSQQHATSLLEVICQTLPGLGLAKVKLAKCHLMISDYDAASSTVNDALRLDPAFSPAHLLKARIALLQDDFIAASKALDEALSHDFSIRKYPVYHLVKSQVLRSKGDIEGAKGVLQESIALPEVGGKKESGKLIPLSDRASVFVELVAVHQELGELDMAEALINRAQETFEGTSEEVRILVCKSELLVKQDDIDGALTLLSEIPETSPAWLKAAETRANIYLNQKRSKQQYTACYMMIVEKKPCKQSYVMLGDSYMQIQEPAAAIGAYEEALKLEPEDSALSTMIGKALFSTHDYQNAIRYYRTALERSSRNLMRQRSLRLALAELFVKLKKWEEAKNVIQEALADEENGGNEESGEDAVRLQNSVSLLLLLSKADFGEGEDDVAVEVLERALMIQNKVIQELVGVREERKKAADINYEIGSYYLKHGKSKKASEYFQKGLQKDGSNESCITALAQIALDNGDCKECEKYCKTLLRMDTGNERASMLMANALFRSGNIDESLFYYRQLLEDKPANFIVLAQMVRVLWRAGRLEEAKLYIERAKKGVPKLAQSAGMNFCQGLYYRFAMQPEDAIRHFNYTRRDVEWGKEAIEQMARVFIGEEMWEEKEPRADASATQKVITSLLRSGEESGMTGGEKSFTILQCYGDLLSHNPKKINVTLRKCVQIIEKQKTYVPALLCMAIALAINKQGPKARNQLKRICKIPYKQKWGEEFENAYLMLATIYIESKKFDLALELCKRCLKHNKSCAKAWEHMGLIMERECAYKDAAEYYEAAWRYSGKRSAPVGYKLAFNYLKAKRYIDAVDVCQNVLSVWKDYPKIREDILDKAREAMRG